MNILDKLNNENLKEGLTDFNIGDTIKVQIRITEGKSSRLQAFSGTVIARKGSGISETITLRRVTFGQGVERVIPVNSPNLESITIEKKGDVRKAKLYYLRDKIGKAARVKEKLDYNKK